MLQRIFSTHIFFFLPLNYFQWIFFKTELSILAISQKLNINLPHTEKFLVLDIYLWYVKAYVHTKTCLQGFLTALLIMAENLETTQMFSWWINKNLEDIRNVPVKFIDGKESAYSVGDLGSIPGLGRSPGEGNATRSRIMVWRVLWTEEPGGTQSVGLQSWTQQSDFHFDFSEMYNLIHLLVIGWLHT